MVMPPDRLTVSWCPSGTAPKYSDTDLASEAKRLVCTSFIHLAKSLYQPMKAQRSRSLQQQALSLSISFDAAKPQKPGETEEEFQDCLL